MREVELHAALIRPFFQCLRRELSAVIDRDRQRSSSAINDPIQSGYDITSAAAEARLYQWGLATKLVDDCEHAKWSTVEQLIVDEIHTPALMRTLRLRHHASMQAHVLAPTHPCAQLQAFQSIQTSHALLVHGPTLSSQHHVNTLVAEAWTPMCDITDA